MISICIGIRILAKFLICRVEPNVHTLVNIAIMFEIAFFSRAKMYVHTQSGRCFDCVYVYLFTDSLINSGRSSFVTYSAGRLLKNTKKLYGLLRKNFYSHLWGYVKNWQPVHWIYFTLGAISSQKIA